MAARVIHLQKRGFDIKLVNEAVSALRNGALVVLPTETVYGIAVRADDQTAVKHLMAAKNRPEKNPFTLAFSSIKRFLPYTPQLSVMAERLARRCFPGPVTLVLNADMPESEVHHLPKEVLRFIMPEDSIGIRIPRHEFTLQVLENADFPIALTSANLSGQVDSTSGQEVMNVLGDKVDWIFDDGASVLKQASTVIQFTGNSNIFQILREGAVSSAQLKRLSQPLILFVCTGNTCRSPMAEVIARDILARKYSVPQETFESQTGISICSAGICANDFSPASEYSRRAVKAMGLDLDSHISQPVTHRLLEYADIIYVMTPAHQRQILSVIPEIAHKVFTLARFSGGIPDPFGNAPEVYEACAHQIRDELEKEFSASDFKKILFTGQI